MHMFIVYLILGLVGGIIIEKRGRVTQGDKLLNRDGGTIHIWKTSIHLWYLLIWIILILLTFYVILGEWTYGFYIGSTLAFLGCLAMVLLISFIVELILVDNNIPDIGFTTFIKLGAFIIVVILLLTTAVRPLCGNCDYNDVFSQLNDTENNTNECEVYITNGSDVRLISWQLATEYLQRGYSGIASSMSTGQGDLNENSDPTIVNGKFVWVNAPQYETIKWFGKTIPFYLYVENTQDGKALHKVNTTFEVHKTKITWNHRINELLFDKYGVKYVNIQSRFTIDDKYNPYWVVYLAERRIQHNKLDLKKILIINASNIDDHKEYSIHDKNIPKWLEVVYPDSYIEDWSGHWGKWREGIRHKLFNKKHLYEREDCARFLVLNGKTYWYIPLKQLNSNVLGGYILQNTRTGETKFYNREDKSMCTRDTAKTQVEKYLESGMVGYRKLRIDEGYLYPIRTDFNHTREAYIFPMYSGYTIQQFAIVDAQYYTITPFISNNLDNVIDSYKAYDFEGKEPEGNVTVEWKSITIERGYIDDSESVIVANNVTYLINKTNLAGGEIKEEDNEWRELKLAISDFERGEDVSLHLAFIEKDVYDVDYLQADLVRRD